MRAMLLVTAAVTTGVLAAACGGGPSEGAASDPPSDPAATSPRPTLPTHLPTPVPPPNAGTPVTGEVPADLLAQIVADAASRAGADDVDVAVVRGESVTWNDGSLGCPKPGMSYTQALVPGYWVVLAVGGAQFDYRATRRGSFTLCEGGSGPLPGTPTR